MATEPPQRNALAELLERQHDRVIARWKVCATRIDPRAKSVSTPALTDAVPEFLRQVIAALREQKPQALGEQVRPTDDAAREHGRQRYRIGFDLRMIVDEYNALRQVLFELMEESGLPLHHSDLRVISTAFANGIADAVEQYSLERERDHRALEAEREKDRRAAEAVREQARRAVEAERERASDLERKLIAIVSHDLRGPLTSISMCAELAGRLGGGDARLARLHTRIRVGAQRATQLIADLLDFTQQRRLGRIPVRRQHISLRPLVREAIEEAEAMFPDRTVSYQEGDPVEGDWDPDRLAQVLSNLLTNAFKYGTPGTPVTLRTGGTALEVVLEVHNWGPPISAPRMVTLFEAFQSADTATRTQPSLGLGLHISNQIVLAHGGVIDVTSSEEAGTTFAVRLPRRAPS